jgi:hypothetical protein
LVALHINQAAIFFFSLAIASTLSVPTEFVEEKVNAVELG